MVYCCFKLKAYFWVIGDFQLLACIGVYHDTIGDKGMVCFFDHLTVGRKLKDMVGWSPHVLSCFYLNGNGMVVLNNNVIRFARDTVSL